MKKILIVDDDLTFQKTMSAKLLTLNYEVLLASDGEMGLKSALSEKPDLILLDIKMPKLDGMGFLKALNANKEAGHISILITSNLSSMDTISQGAALGVKGYIIKSDESLDTIVREVESALKPPVTK